MIKNICYITYQTFPANTANSLQTISNIKYFVKNECNVSLIYPLREKNSSDSIQEAIKMTSEKFPDSRILICGSLYLAGKVLELN